MVSHYATDDYPFKICRSRPDGSRTIYLKFVDKVLCASEIGEISYRFLPEPRKNYKPLNRRVAGCKVQISKVYFENFTKVESFFKGTFSC